MVPSAQSYAIYDSLYGRVAFDQPLSWLISAPIVQRMRHVRLSNIDSLDMPGIANLSRYEHVLGVAHLATLVGFRQSLSMLERYALDAAALLHDWAITSFGHLIEEAFQYVGATFAHETRLVELAAGETSSDILGLQRQILGGRQLGLEPWTARAMSGREDARRLLALITDYIAGEGRFGKTICGTIDLDNIDNVTRMAYHLGLVRDGGIAERLAKGIVGADVASGAPIFSDAVVPDIEAWLVTRRSVYDLLMLSERDFAGKLMLIYATVAAFEAGQLTEQDWAMVDAQFFEALRTSQVAPAAREAATRWYVGELWDMAPLSWFSGNRPSYPMLKEYSDLLSDRLGRPFFAYAIKDKRDRRLTLRIENLGVRTFGADSDQWLLGFGSPTRQSISRKVTEQAWSLAESFFLSRRLGDASSIGEKTEEPAWLI